MECMTRVNSLLQLLRLRMDCHFYVKGSNATKQIKVIYFGRFETPNTQSARRVEDEVDFLAGGTHDDLRHTWSDHETEQMFNAWNLFERTTIISEERNLSWSVIMKQNKLGFEVFIVKSQPFPPYPLRLTHKRDQLQGFVHLYFYNFTKIMRSLQQDSNPRPPW